MFATLARYLPPDSHDGKTVLDVPEGSTVHDVLQRLGVPEALERVMLVNGADASPACPLADGDVIDVFPPLAGGG